MFDDHPSQAIFIASASHLKNLPQKFISFFDVETDKILLKLVFPNLSQTEQCKSNSTVQTLVYLFVKTLTQKVA